MVILLYSKSSIHKGPVVTVYVYNRTHPTTPDTKGHPLYSAP
jgi:hypothetical protein